jgi:hypothetical protein
MRHPRLWLKADEKSPSERGSKSAFCEAGTRNSKVRAMITAVNSVAGRRLAPGE